MGGIGVNGKLLNQLREFGLPYIRSGDIDPVYPMLREVNRLRGNSLEQTAWHTVLYITWYHLGSAERMLRWSGGAVPVLSTGVERRGFRGAIGAVKALKFLNWFEALRQKMDITCWIENTIQDGGKDGWRRLFAAFQQIPDCGTWAAYKWCDLTRNVLGFPITAPNIGYGGGGEHAGPVPGMCQLTGLPWNVAAMDEEAQEQLYMICRGHGIPLDGIEQLETILCDFNSMTHGRYYVGHDLDKQMEDIMGLPEVYWQARRNVFPEEFLGEFRGWNGVRKELNTYYLRTGKVYRGGARKI